jgi:hypothetical protein
MINDYLRGRACIEFVRESLIQGEFLSLSFSCSFCFGWFAIFRAFVGITAFPSSR